MLKDVITVRRDDLRDPEVLADYLQDHLRRGPDEFRIALREAVLAQAGGVSGLSRRTGLARTGLYKALSANGNPSYRTVSQVLDALGMETIITPRVIGGAGRQGTMEQTKTASEIVQTQNSNEAIGEDVQEAPEETKQRILPGSGRGLFVMADDFDAPLPEFSEYM